MGPINVEKLAATQYTPDPSIANKSSIGLLLEYDKKTALLSGDAPPETLLESINKIKEKDLQLDLFKLSHHGSKHNLSPDILKKLRTKRYVISTNGKVFGHPDRETIARILLRDERKRDIMFNYRTDITEVWNLPGLMNKYNYSVIFPENEDKGLSVPLS